MTEYCRLCAELKDSCEIATSIDDVEQLMEQKLRACCQWTDENTEHRLSHSVCSICLDKLDKCWLFAQSVQLAQQRLLEIFENETESSQHMLEMVEMVEIKPLLPEIEQIDNDCAQLDCSNSLPSAKNDLNPVQEMAAEDREIANLTNPLESNETEKRKSTGTVHTCPVCGKCFRKRWNFIEHMRTHSDERAFECRLCHRKFKTSSNLLGHCKKQSQNRCEICVREFCTVMELNAHKQLDGCEPPPSTFDRNNTPKVKFNEVANDSNQTESNEMENRKSTDTVHKCPACGKCFRKRWNFNQHMRSHSDERPFECLLCHRKFKTKRNLHVHCNNKLENKCEICLREFCTTIQLYEHKQLACESSPTIDQRSSIAHFDVDSMNTHRKDVSNKFSQDEQQMENRINQPISMANMSDDSREQFASIVGQMQRMNGPFLVSRPRSSFECGECGRIFSKKSNMLQHQMIHNDERPFECWLCHKKCRTKAHMRKHLEIHTTCPETRKDIDQAKKRAKLIELYGDGEPIDFNQLKLKCHECGKHFLRVSKLKEHLATHSNERPFECWLCHKTFKLMKALKAHVKTHLCRIKRSALTDPSWICEQCGKVFRHKISLNEHIQSAHSNSDERPHQCDLCGASFKTRHSFTTHRRVTHTDRRFNCTHCDKTFRFKQSLKRHLDRHTGAVAKPFSCDMCGKAYPLKSALKEHIRIHTGEKPYKCDHCVSNFSTKAYLRSHMKDVHGISTAIQNREKLAKDPSTYNEPILSFKCDTCGLGYKSQKLLQRHQKSHTEFEHACIQCDKKFRYKHSLKSHMETHTGVINKPQICDFCGKGFRQKYELREHRRIHTGEKPYNCEHCSSNFRTMSSFYSHLTKIHGISVSARNREERIRATALSTSSLADQPSQSSN